MIYPRIFARICRVNKVEYILMSIDTKQLITKDGIVAEALQGGMFKINLEDETVAIATISGKMRKFHIRILPGDKVKAEFSPHDLTHGRISYRYR